MYPTKKLWEILKIQNWYAFDSKLFNEIEWFPIIRIRDIKNSNTNTRYKWEIKDEFIVKKWDFLIWMDWEFKCYMWNWLDALLNQRVCRLLPIMNDINLKYIYYWINQYLKIIEDNTPFVTVKHISSNQIKNIDFPLPPIPTQKLIVQKLDSAFENIDKNINLTKENLKNLEELNKSILEKVFSEWEYEMKKLWEISKTTSWWTPLRDKKEYWWWNIPWLKSWELNDNLKINSSEEFITEIWLKNSSAKIFKKWTLLIALYWATAWKLWILDFDSTTNQAVCSIQNLFNLFVEKYLFYFLLSRREQIIKDSFWWAQPNISKTYLDQIQIPLPPLQKQKEIVSYLDEVFAKNKELKTKYELQLKELEELKQSLLKDAFEGRLVKE